MDFHLIGQQQEVIIGPDIQLARIVQEGEYIFLDSVDVSAGQTLAERGFEFLQSHFLTVELANPFLKVIPVQRNAISDIPLEIIPVPSLDPVLPDTECQSMHLAGEEVRKRDTTGHEGFRLQEELLLGSELQRRNSIHFNFDPYGLLRLKSSSSPFS